MWFIHNFHEKNADTRLSTENGNGSSIPMKNIPRHPSTVRNMDSMASQSRTKAANPASIPTKEGEFARIEKERKMVDVLWRAKKLQLGFHEIHLPRSMCFQHVTNSGRSFRPKQEITIRSSQGALKLY